MSKRLSAERLARYRDKLSSCRDRMPVAVFDELHGVMEELVGHIDTIEAELAAEKRKLHTETLRLNGVVYELNNRISLLK
jgi:hypothetical protein